MANYENEINSWPVLKNGLHYKWLVDYAAFSAFGTFELTAEEWEKRDLIVNFKGNSELTTEMDHQESPEEGYRNGIRQAEESFGQRGSTVYPGLHSLQLLRRIPSAVSRSSARRYARLRA